MFLLELLETVYLIYLLLSEFAAAFLRIIGTLEIVEINNLGKIRKVSVGRSLSLEFVGEFEEKFSCFTAPLDFLDWGRILDQTAVL